MTEGPAIALTAEALAEVLDATLIGKASRPLSALDPLEDAGPASLSFIRDEKNAHRWATTGAGAVLVSRSVYDRSPALFEPRDGHAIILVDDADRALIAILARITPPIHAPTVGIDPTASIDATAAVAPTARIAPGVIVGPHARIDEDCIIHAGVSIGAHVSIGAATELRPRVTIMDRCTVGRRCLLHPGVVIGADGFGFRPDPTSGAHTKIPHAGAVAIGDDVEIGANSTIDRGKLGNTTIGDGTKIDNLVQIGHNCTIGRHCIICGNCGLAGSVTVEDHATLAGGVGVADGRRIGRAATVGARAGVMRDIPPNETWLGTPASPARECLRQIAAIEALPNLIRPLKALLSRSGGPPPDRS
ncbi:MAG: UDP-3-O-(3-hydroxymyristoyl)glucosamine N-acyltransferase [Phycisphaerales bacterium]